MIRTTHDRPQAGNNTHRSTTSANDGVTPGEAPRNRMPCSSEDLDGLLDEVTFVEITDPLVEAAAELAEAEALRGIHVANPLDT
jgi:hypothetical protein